MICLVDDRQWLDTASTKVLTFVARRLHSESVGLVFGARELSEDATGLPQLVPSAFFPCIWPLLPAQSQVDDVVESHGPPDLVEPFEMRLDVGRRRNVGADVLLGGKLQRIGQVL